MQTLPTKRINRESQQADALSNDELGVLVILDASNTMGAFLKMLYAACYGDFDMTSNNVDKALASLVTSGLVIRNECPDSRLHFTINASKITQQIREITYSFACNTPCAHPIEVKNGTLFISRVGWLSESETAFLKRYRSSPKTTKSFIDSVLKQQVA